MRVLVVVGLVLFVSLLAQPAVSQMPDDKLIVPGQRIGKYPLQTTATDLADIIGWPPDSRLSCTNNRLLITDSPGKTYQYTWYLMKPVRDLTLLAHGHDVAQPNELLQLSWDSDACRFGGPTCRQSEPPVEFKTDRGITFGTAVSSLETAYGRPTWVDTYRVEYPSYRFGAAYTVYDNLGVAFWSRDGKIEWFFIFRPGKAPRKHSRGVSGVSICS